MKPDSVGQKLHIWLNPEQRYSMVPELFLLIIFVSLEIKKGLVSFLVVSDKRDQWEMENAQNSDKQPDWPALNAACRCARIHPGWSPPEPEPPGRNCCRPPPPAQLTRRGHQVKYWSHYHMSSPRAMMDVGRGAREMAGWLMQTWGWPDGSLPAVLRIHDIVVWIRIRESMPLTNGSGSWNFRHWPSRRQEKTHFSKSFSAYYFLKVR